MGKQNDFGKCPAEAVLRDRPTLQVRMFSMEVVRLKGPYGSKSRRGLDVLCLAYSMADAVMHVQSKYPKWTIRNVQEQLVIGPKHFVMSEWVPD